MATETEMNMVEAQGQQTCPAPGTFCWNELMATDTKASVEFYSSLLGWAPEPFQGDIPYIVFNFNGSQIAGLVPSPDPQMPSQWLSYIRVENIDDTVRRAEGLGATILLSPKDIPSVGRIAIIQDPQGATVGLVQPVE